MKSARQISRKSEGDQISIGRFIAVDKKPYGSRRGEFHLHRFTGLRVRVFSTRK